MVFLLVGGPRDGQLVDDLPRGYAAAPLGPRSPVMTLFDDLVVHEAVWQAPRAL
ncbi:hypothetical protein [Microbacterium jiangjiandongii]|uniref:hypothetical protein n=1 Tax=Microbacterium jiangjiandongii TaxID=3049071 RepID=UPI00214B9371|nr:hypothetical protein [Microbacterium sp. zg.Y843]MCR2815187.1 hypothetical protein [Microbacterium sp. zg.Y843]